MTNFIDDKVRVKPKIIETKQSLKIRCKITEWPWIPNKNHSFVEEEILTFLPTANLYVYPQ